jgi:hypothetical protein
MKQIANTLSRRVLGSACLLAVATVGGVSAAESSPWTIPLRVEWEADPPREGLQAVCGKVLNDQPVPAWHVVLLVEGLNGMDQVTNSRQVEVLGDVPSNGYAEFCVPEPAGATTYRVRVIGADWMSAGAP